MTHLEGVLDDVERLDGVTDVGLLDEATVVEVFLIVYMLRVGSGV